jgi:hypothetical protein
MAVAARLVITIVIELGTDKHQIVLKMYGFLRSKILAS